MKQCETCEMNQDLLTIFTDNPSFFYKYYNNDTKMIYLKTFLDKNSFDVLAALKFHLGLK